MNIPQPSQAQDELIGFMASIGFEFHPNKYYSCFTKEEGSCELTVSGARDLQSLIERERLAAEIKGIMYCYGMGGVTLKQQTYMEKRLAQLQQPEEGGDSET